MKPWECPSLSLVPSKNLRKMHCCLSALSPLWRSVLAGDSVRVSDGKTSLLIKLHCFRCFFTALALTWKGFLGTISVFLKISFLKLLVFVGVAQADCCCPDLTMSSLGVKWMRNVPLGSSSTASKFDLLGNLRCRRRKILSDFLALFVCSPTVTDNHVCPLRLSCDVTVLWWRHLGEVRWLCRMFAACVCFCMCVCACSKQRHYNTTRSEFDDFCVDDECEVHVWLPRLRFYFLPCRDRSLWTRSDLQISRVFVTQNLGTFETTQVGFQPWVSNFAGFWWDSFHIDDITLGSSLNRHCLT